MRGCSGLQEGMRGGVGHLHSGTSAKCLALNTTFQPLPGLSCVTDGFGEQLLLTLLHPSRLSVPWLGKKKWQVRKKERGHHSKQANTKRPGLSSSLGITAIYRALWRARDADSVSLTDCASYKCRITPALSRGHSLPCTSEYFQNNTEK